MVINLKNIELHNEDVHESIDILVVESRKNDELISWEDAKNQLKNKGKL